MAKNKDFVAMATAYCPICGKEHETNEILIDKRFKPITETCVGMALCEKHQKMAANGYIALVEIDPAKSKPQEGLYCRTGMICHITTELFEETFDVPVPGHDQFYLAHVVPEVMQALQDAYERDIGPLPPEIQ